MWPFHLSFRFRPSRLRQKKANRQTRTQITCVPCSDKYVSRAEYDELKIRVDRLEALLQPQTGLAAQSSCPDSSPQQQHQQRPSAVGHRTQGPGPAQQVPYHPLSPPGNHPGPSRVVAPGAPAQDYGAALVLRGPNSPPGRTSLPPLASLANGPGPFDGPPPSSRSLHRDRERDRDHRDRDQHASDQQQHRHGELVYAPPPPPPPPLQQPLQPPHQQTKNSRAQTLTPLGERLRLCTTPQGPAAVVLRLRHRPNIFCRPRNSSRLRLLARAAQVRRTAIAIMSAYSRPRRRLFLGHRCGVQSATSGSSSAIPTSTGTSFRVERGGRALCR